MRAPRLLLINPAPGSSFWGFEHALRLLGRKYSTAPLGLATVAALTPPGWRVRIVDENVEPVDVDEDCDLVGITAMNVQAQRAFALADAFRRRGRRVVLGGPFVTLEPERCAPHADVLVVGEAERTWPVCCADFERGQVRERYVEDEGIDLGESPVPRYDLLRAEAYASLPVQTSRGCPYSCEFCDIIVMQGRRVRVKPVERVLAEVRAAERAGASSIFFTDDNFVGNLKYARGLLDGLIEQGAATRSGTLLFSQASVNLAEQPEILERMVAAGFTRVFLGVETPRQASLAEAGKRVNTHGDLLGRIHRIQQAGLVTWAGMIVGFDHDDPLVFDEQARFLDEAGIAIAMVGMLNAPPRTPLYRRLQAEGRIDPRSDWADNCAWTNIVPKRMSRAELLLGYASLLREIYEPARFAARLRRNVERMADAPTCVQSSRFPTPGELGALARALVIFGTSREAARRRHFLPNLLWALRHHPRRVVETAIHLGMWSHYGDYVPRLVGELEQAAWVERVRAREREFTARPVGDQGLEAAS